VDTDAVVFDAPHKLALRSVALTPPKVGEAIVEVEWSGISTGTERLLFNGAMPPFPGLAYPLVPGYETVGRVVEIVGEASSVRVGQRVFVPGATCFVDARGLFGGAAARLHVPVSRLASVPEGLGEEAVLLALAATAQHALAGGALPDLIVGHGVLGRLLARLAVARGASPVVWETNATRRAGARGYRVIDPSEDTRRDYGVVCDVSGHAAIVDTLVGRLSRGGEIVLAGFYSERVSFAFPPAFMKEARLRVAAEWQRADLDDALAAITRDPGLLDALVTHRSRPHDAERAYGTAFGDSDCLKMILDWRANA
jgi:3-hydroxyethyl bacteriochlorophyllide a dehydrogenase